ncbi:MULTISPECIES: hypothetical protein [unclassified Rhizobacter]|uniref:hypothetical protein n=1 Tax=unclassified Rhizobacter TaxID=2640088 RepID=UPI0007009291|nr:MULTISPECIES: hypothetical protein [unclassified Rhizobacter]KQU77873.1 hypothetical protein ASC88_18615 [Rhizobacter sp. Root29]KQW10240.1 hypothetical protein ASC98_22850 [Rhizobacter sp. Root1238]KRB20230.1 hypothetical protein ASE08_22685 [Rhizobacter sp. Root16D2]
MTARLRFAPALGEWVAQHLAQGQPPAALVDALRERQVAPAAAQALVDAFVRARERGTPLPVDTVALGACLADGPVIETNDRRIRVAMRADEPVLAVLQDVLDVDECEALIALARPRLKPSTLVDPMTGRDVANGLRGSLGMFFRPAETPLIARLDRRLAELMGLPVSHGEGLQLLHYPVGAGSAPHFDFLQPSARSGSRPSGCASGRSPASDAGGDQPRTGSGCGTSPPRNTSKISISGPSGVTMR